MELKISNVSKKGNLWRTSVSQQQLVNTLLAEKQPVQAQPMQPVQPVQNWGGKKQAFQNKNAIVKALGRFYLFS